MARRFANHAAFVEEMKNLDREAHLAHVGTPEYAMFDFATEDYFYTNLIPSMVQYAKREGLPMQASWSPERGTWRITNAANQPTLRAFVFVDEDGSWRPGPLYQPEFLAPTTSKKAPRGQRARAGSVVKGKSRRKK